MIPLLIKKIGLIRDVAGVCIPLHSLKASANNLVVYLGVSSTASFSTRIASLTQRALAGSDDAADVNFSLDGDAYEVSWERLGPRDQPDLTGLPAIERATYLMHTVSFYLCGLFKLFDEEEFLRCMREFYASPVEVTNSHRLWLTQYLLMMAFGTGLLKSDTFSAELAGSEFFVRAMSVLPETHLLHEEPVLGAEVLTMIALFFHCLDMRQTAYSYVRRLVMSCNAFAN